VSRVCLINGSPRGKLSSSSLIFLQGLDRSLAGRGVPTALITVGRRSGEPTPEGVLQDMADAEALIFSFPLYAYSTPAALTRFLEELSLHLHRHATAAQPARVARVYALVNSGNADPRVNTEALRVMRLFCRKAGLSWRFGAAIAGGMVVAMTRGFPPVGWVLRRLYRRIGDDLRSAGAPPAADVTILPIIPKRIMNWFKDSKWSKKFMARQPQEPP
jgi:multimeric flavodoxin WrbA